MHESESPLSVSEHRHDLTYTNIGPKDFTLDDNLPNLRCQPDNVHIPNPPKVYLGALDTLPLELLCEILQKLDLRTLTDFRHVNRRAMWLVESFPQYKAIRKHAYNALRGIIYIEVSRWITCEMLYEKLCTAECEECGDFGGYLYILTCKRVCFLCLSEDKQFLPLRYRHAIRKFGLKLPILRTLPSMKCIRGTYSSNLYKVRSHLAVVDSNCARRASITLHGSISAMEQYVSSMAVQDPFDGKSGNPLRFVAIVRTPWLNKSPKEPEWGFHCKGCRNSYISRPLHFRRKFTIGSFKEHLRECGNIRHGEHHLN
ncbi:hypothetical protein BC826DRAFT_960139 [Russula brevipes]|nr:hypothetical protein BC826DRAFT_960139 [Russula brevipes]